MQQASNKEDNLNKYNPSKHKSSLLDSKMLSQFLCNGAVGVIETDTIYGLVGSAFYPDVVNRIYQIKHRNINKPFIILISDVEQLKYFGVDVTKDLLRQVREYWPGPYSLILPIDNPEKFEYLTRGGNKLCFRMPNVLALLELLDATGPLVAPSANLESYEPATTIQEAYEYFGEKVDFYCDGGTVKGKASKIIEFVDGKIIELRS